MNKIHLLSVFATVTALSGAAFAHGHGGGRMFEKVDANSDGKITLAEAQAGAQTRFTALDKNKDGAVTQAELEGVRHPMMKKADTNNDGKITLAEVQAQSQTWFGKFDKNNDKVITKEEMQAGKGDHPCHKS